MYVQIVSRVQVDVSLEFLKNFSENLFQFWKLEIVCDLISSNNSDNNDTPNKIELWQKYSADSYIQFNQSSRLLHPSEGRGSDHKFRGIQIDWKLVVQ